VNCIGILFTIQALTPSTLLGIIDDPCQINFDNERKFKDDKRVNLI